MCTKTSGVPSVHHTPSPVCTTSVCTPPGPQCAPSPVCTIPCVHHSGSGRLRISRRPRPLAGLGAARGGAGAGAAEEEQAEEEYNASSDGDDDDDFVLRLRQAALETTYFNLGGDGLLRDQWRGARLQCQQKYVALATTTRAVVQWQPRRIPHRRTQQRPAVSATVVVRFRYFTAPRCVAFIISARTPSFYDSGLFLLAPLAPHCAVKSRAF